MDNLIYRVSAIEESDKQEAVHILYMMAVEHAYRGNWVGNALEKARIDWMCINLERGRCVISTNHNNRFERLGFGSISEIEDRYLMILEF